MPDKSKREYVPNQPPALPPVSASLLGSIFRSRGRSVRTYSTAETASSSIEYISA
jgi:hypothetical protein